MRASWAYQDREGMREAIWSWLTRPAGEWSARRSGSARRGGPMAHAFELWIRHLALLERVVELAPPGWGELLAAEMEGLEMLRLARQRYAAEYRRCGECGEAVRGKICTRCGAVESRQPAGN